MLLIRSVIVNAIPAP